MTAQPESDEPIDIYLEVGQRRVFACSLEWPGWCRSGKNEEQAIERLAAYTERYAAVAHEARVPFPAGPGSAFQIVERIPGSVGYTDFGAPGAVASRDKEPLPSEEAERIAALVNASWVIFTRVCGTVPAELRKGPRGGGRDRDQMIDHVLGAEASYARKLGLKHRPPERHDAPAIAALHAGILEALRAPSGGTPSVPAGWFPRYAARRIAWHVLDHAWEMEDRGAPTS